MYRPSDTSTPLSSNNCGTMDSPKITDGWWMPGRPLWRGASLLLTAFIVTGNILLLVSGRYIRTDAGVDTPLLPGLSLVSFQTALYTHKPEATANFISTNETLSYPLIISIFPTTLNFISTTSGTHSIAPHLLLHPSSILSSIAHTLNTTSDPLFQAWTHPPLRDAAIPLGLASGSLLLATTIGLTSIIIDILLATTIPSPSPQCSLPDSETLSGTTEIESPPSSFAPLRLTLTSLLAVATGLAHYNTSLLTVQLLGLLRLLVSTLPTGYPLSIQSWGHLPLLSTSCAAALFLVIGSAVDLIYSDRDPSTDEPYQPLSTEEEEEEEEEEEDETPVPPSALSLFPPTTNWRGGRPHHRRVIRGDVISYFNNLCQRVSSGTWRSLSRKNSADGEEGDYRDGRVNEGLGHWVAYQYGPGLGQRGFTLGGTWPGVRGVSGGSLSLIVPGWEEEVDSEDGSDVEEEEEEEEEEQEDGGLLQRQRSRGGERGGILMKKDSTKK